MKNSGNCECCGIDIAYMSSQTKYCSDRCYKIIYYKKRGIKIWTKKCACGCKRYIISRFEKINKKYMKGHEKRVLKLKYCGLCSKEIEIVYDYLLPTCRLKLCLSCYTKIFNMSLQDNK
jgi:hypothetical protein